MPTRGPPRRRLRQTRRRGRAPGSRSHPTPRARRGSTGFTSRKQVAGIERLGSNRSRKRELEIARIGLAQERDRAELDLHGVLFFARADPARAKKRTPW